MRIKSKYHRGEAKIWNSEKQKNSWAVDGFAITDHGCKVYEFNGSQFHKNCPHCGHEPDENWDKKVSDIKKAGYEFQVIWECQYDRIFPKLDYKDTPYFPEILKKKTTESDLIQGIKSGKLFGFIVADVESPEKVINEMKEFPPLIRKMTLTDEHLSDYTRNRLKIEKPNMKKFQRDSLIQCFHGQQLLLMTPLVRFYMEKGLKIFNITKFIQYIPSTALNPFASHVTRMRIDAEKNALYTKGNTAKVFGNSSYGKVSSFIFFLIYRSAVDKIGFNGVGINHEEQFLYGD